MDGILEDKLKGEIAMNIYERISIYTAKDFIGDFDSTLADVDRISNAYYDQLCDIMKNFGKDEDGVKYQAAWTSEEISKDDLPEGAQHLAYPDKDYLEEITIITKKEIDDSLSEEEQQVEREKYSDQVVSDTHQLDKIPNFKYSWESEFIEADEIMRDESWAFKQLFNKEEEIKLLEEQKEQNIKDNEFEIAYTIAKTINAKTSENFTEDLRELPYRFMEDVVRINGTDKTMLSDAILAVTDTENESMEFSVKLQNKTLSSEEYRKASEKSQGEVQENTR